MSHDAVERVHRYFEIVGILAQRAALSGRPGRWSELIEQADAASQADIGHACDPQLHARYLELMLWGEMLSTALLPERQQAVGTAIRRIAEEHAHELIGDLEPLLDRVCPPLREAAPDPGHRRPSRQEIVVVRQLRHASENGTPAALTYALGVLTAYSRTVGASSAHRCEAYPLVTLNVALPQALQETIPAPHREFLAAWAQMVYFARNAPDQPEPKFLHIAPEFPRSSDPLNHFGPTWLYVAGLGRGEDVLDPVRSGGCSMNWRRSSGDV